MSDDRRQTWGLIIAVLDVLENHGYHKADDQHTGRAVGLIGDLAHIYEGTREAPAGAYHVPTPEPRQASLDQAGPAAAQRAEAIAAAGMSTILAALDEASGYKRDRAAGCADCQDQSCGTCQHRLDAARAYDSLAILLQHARDDATPDMPSRLPTADVPGNRRQRQAVPAKEASRQASSLTAHQLDEQYWPAPGEICTTAGHQHAAEARAGKPDREAGADHEAER